MLNLPQGYEKMDSESRNQALQIAITSKIDELEQAISNLKKSQEISTQSFLALNTALANLKIQCNSHEHTLMALSEISLKIDKKPAPIVEIPKTTFSFWNFFKKK